MEIKDSPLRMPTTLLTLAISPYSRYFEVSVAHEPIAQTSSVTKWTRLLEYIIVEVLNI